MRSRMPLLALFLVLVSCSSNAERAGAPASDVSATGEAVPGGDPAAAGAPPASGEAAVAAARTSPADAWTAIRSGALLVDVRAQAEFDQGHLEGALLIPHDQIAARASELGDDRSRAIVLYCRTGNRSAQAKKALEGLGFTNVMNAGGYDTLKQAR